MESRLRQIRIAKPSSPVWLVTEAFVTKWNQRIPKIRRWQFMWNASNCRSSAFRRVHVVDVNSLKRFETRLDKFWGNQDVMFDWTAEITGTGDRSEFKLETVSESTI